jgi:uncharacterized membrane protein YidH (DUF202 family)
MPAVPEDMMDQQTTLAPDDGEPAADPDAEATLDSTGLARQRTYLAAERTLFAVLRTGLAIAAGGTVIITLLGDTWPTWVQVPLAAVFLLVGYSLLIYSMQRYRAIARRIQREGGAGLEIVPARSMTILTGALNVAITIVLVLFLLSIFD